MNNFYKWTAFIYLFFVDFLFFSRPINDNLEFSTSVFYKGLWNFKSLRVENLDFFDFTDILVLEDRFFKRLFYNFFVYNSY